jgi:hypothetical protein
MRIEYADLGYVFDGIKRSLKPRIHLDHHRTRIRDQEINTV